MRGGERMEKRYVWYDVNLQMEAYQFKGIMQKFPDHFHDYYVIGFIEEGTRRLICQGKETIIYPGDLLIFNPYDIHSCEQIDGKTLDYRCLNIEQEVMKKIAYELSGDASLPSFSHHVLVASELVEPLRTLHQTITNKEEGLVKEELFYSFFEELIFSFSNLSMPPLPPAASQPIQMACMYLQKNFAEKINLTTLSDISGWSKYHFLRTFTKEMGISPNSYLVTIRIQRVKELLEQGVMPIDVAQMTGFSDQSHLSKFFKSLIGLTPKQYMRIFEMERARGNVTHG